MYFESPHIREWIALGKAKAIPLEIARDFGCYLNDRAWDASGLYLDWSKCNGIAVNLVEATDSQLLDWLHQTTVQQDRYLVFWFTPNEPAIACESEFAIVNVDHAFWKAPGRRYMFSASIDGDVFRPHFDHLIEYDGMNTLRAARAPGAGVKEPG